MAGEAPLNPPAFPSPACGDWSPEYGMTLRDWFAGQALACVAETYLEWQLKAWFGERGGIRREEIRARAAYEVADAMLAERAKDGRS